MTLLQDPPNRTGRVPSGDAAGPATASSGASGPSGSGGGPGVGGRPSVLRFADSLDRALESLLEVPVWSMSDAELGEALVALTGEQARLAELRGRVLVEAHARKVGHDEGAASTPAWLAHRTKQTVQGVFADLRLAEALEEQFTLTRAAMAGRLVPNTQDITDASEPQPQTPEPQTPEPRTPELHTPESEPEPGMVPGVVDAEKARIIIRAVNGLSADHGDLVTPEVRRRAEEHLVDLAARFDAPTLRKLAKRLVEVVCPEAADAAEGKKLAAEEAAARRKAFVQLRDNGDGTSSGWFKVPTLHAELFRKVLDELTSPRLLGEARLDPETGKPLSTSALRGQGFLTLLEHHLDLDTLPGSGGSPFTMVVSVHLDTLRAELGVATVETGHRISAGEARRLACQAGIIPMVLGGDSMPLDVGRERRFFTKHQRLAMDQVYGGCAADGCDLPPARVEYHHTDPWGRHGQTNLKDGLPLCPPHHHMADHPHLWDMRRLPTGAVRFTRRT
ncbi:MAG: DUF222 domain-containing protein [Actinomycetes bacterium]